MKNSTFATQWNADLIDEYYEQWLRNPKNLNSEWQAFFEGFELAQAQPAKKQKTQASAPSSLPASQGSKQAHIIGAIYAYRRLGHTQAHFNPLRKKVEPNPDLSLETLGLSESDLSETFNTDDFLGGQEMTGREIINHLQETYCGSIGVEYMHISSTKKRRWLQERMEPTLNRPNFRKEKELHTLKMVNQAEAFENFLHTRYVGQKRFSLEGGETFIAAVDALVNAAPSHEIKEVVIGMAHRGRLNVLSNILGKSYEFIFKEFSANYVPDSPYGGGDVKYHLGYEAKKETLSGGSVDLRLTPNPSHLESVNPVVMGRARALQRIISKDNETINRQAVLPFLVHGDAAIAGQGIVAEVLNLSQLKGYHVGGTIHFVINNQIGFTTDPTEGRSTPYCTDIAKTIEAPIFHVNSDDPLAVIFVMELALEYRQTFAEDVMIDMYCYRKHGHNESDEPAFTQPTLYQQISEHPPISKTFSAQLIKKGHIDEGGIDTLKKEFNEVLEEAFKRTKNTSPQVTQEGKVLSVGSYTRQQPNYSFGPFTTGVKKEVLSSVARALTTLPEGFTANKKIKRQLDTKRKNFENGEKIDWAFAESLSWGSLLLEGTPVRLSGQDSERGTFSQRHAAFFDMQTRKRHCPLEELASGHAKFCVHNSCLSEAAVLGFDYGYSMDYPQMLSMWEAQFGDFANGAQVIIDQFITSAETKWQRSSGLVMLLPHGYEGQGPEHSSGRIERYLQACGENNIEVCIPSTPAQYFHLLRRQMHRNFLKPVIVFTPKSLLRLPACTSTVESMTKGCFEEIVDDATPPTKTERVILCAGKVYYDLLAYRNDNKIKNTAIVRIEQIYPFHTEKLKKIAKQYTSAKHWVWCQEEPQNMGCWSHLSPILEETLGQKCFYAGREQAASTASGSLTIHNIEQEALIETAFISK